MSKQENNLKKDTTEPAQTKKKPFRFFLIGIVRLIVMFLITMEHTVFHLISGMIKGFTRRLATLNASKWGKMLKVILGARLEVIGNIPPEGALLIANHRSYIDIGLIGSILPSTFLAKAELQSWPVMGYAAKLAKVVFVDRENAESRKKSRDDIAETLNGGFSIIIFPEGTSYQGPGALEFKKGPFKIATEGEFAVVPVAIEYKDPTDAWVDDDTFIGHFIRAFSKFKIHCTLSIGPVYKDTDPDRLHKNCWEWVNNEVLRLRNQYDQA